MHKSRSSGTPPSLYLHAVYPTVGILLITPSSGTKTEQLDKADNIHSWLPAPGLPPGASGKGDSKAESLLGAGMGPTQPAPHPGECAGDSHVSSPLKVWTAGAHGHGLLEYQASQDEKSRGKATVGAHSCPGSLSVPPQGAGSVRPASVLLTAASAPGGPQAGLGQKLGCFQSQCCMNPISGNRVTEQTRARSHRATCREA